MKWIKYQIMQSIIDEETILIEKKIGYSEANLTIAQAEAYNGEYTIEEDSTVFNEEPLAIEFGGTGGKTAEDAIANLGVMESPAFVINSGNIVITTEPNTEYRFNDVTSLNMTVISGTNFSCHGFVTFSAGTTPVISISGYTQSIGDITEAAAGETWEFDCEEGYILWVKWGE